MRAFHSLWTRPRRGDGSVFMPDYELLTMMLSALEWRRHNGEIRMVTDSPGAAFLAGMGLETLWSEPPDTALDRMDGGVDPFFFWAAGKLEALRRTDAPCVMLDTDLIVWADVSARLGGRVVAAHSEQLAPDVYPDPYETFSLLPDYAPRAEWDLSLCAANTAFLYLPDNALKAYYTDEAFRFMRALRGGGYDPSVTMCFAEQRILPMCAAARGYGMAYLLDENAKDAQDVVTHLWGFKRRLAVSARERVEYCLGCTARILTDFPEWESTLAANALTKPYLSGMAP